MGCAMEYNLEQLQKVICCDFFHIPQPIYMLNLPQVYLMSFTAEELYSKWTEFINWLLTGQKSEEVMRGVTKQRCVTTKDVVLLKVCMHVCFSLNG